MYTLKVLRFFEYVEMEGPKMGKKYWNTGRIFEKKLF
jgi:hypothetical protein